MGHQPSILVIDDEQFVLDGCSRVLTTEGYEVHTAPDGRAGIESFKANRPDVVLLDLKMPVLDGMGFLDAALELAPEQMVIVITGLATVETAVEAMKHGAYDLLTKPFTPDQLRIVVKRAVEKIELTKTTRELQAQAEKNLRDIATEKSRLNTIVQSMADGVVVTDTDNEIVLANPAFSRLLSLDDTDLLGKNLSSISRFGPVADDVTRVLDGPDRVHFFKELDNGQPDREGPPSTLMAHVSRITGADGEVLGAVTVLRDVTPLKELDRMKAEFVGMVAHDLKAPLASIHQQLSVLLMGIAGPITDKQESLLTKAQKRAENMVEFIKNLLELSRVESGRLVADMEPLDLGPLAAGVCEDLMPQAQAKGQTLTYTAPEDLPRIHGDRRSLVEVIVNLITNAVRYTPDGGRIEVAISPTGHHLALTVSDNGLGIAPADQLRVFERFTRITTEKTKQIQGTGLGLSIVKDIVEAHDGQITLASMEGEGSTFRVLLPISDSEVESDKAPPNRTDAPAKGSGHEPDRPSPGVL